MALTVGLLLPGNGPIPVGIGWGLPNIDHFAAFVGLACLVRWARWQWRTSTQFLILAAYGLFTEFAQALVPERTTDVFDMLTDVTGIAAGFAVCLGIEKMVARRRESNAH